MLPEKSGCRQNIGQVTPEQKLQALKIECAAKGLAENAHKLGE